MDKAQRSWPWNFICERIQRILTDPHVVRHVPTEQRKAILGELLVLLETMTPPAGLREVVQELERIRAHSIALYTTRAALDDILHVWIDQLSARIVPIEPGMAFGALEGETFGRTL